MGMRTEGTIDLVEVARGTDANSNRTITMEGTLVEDPTRKVIAQLTWRARLP
jgi:hypothetical protein